MAVYDVLIIGAGAAGISAAIQLKRCGINPVIMDGGQVGGLLWNANLVENYPGFPGGIPGPKLVKLFLKHLEITGIIVRPEKALSVNRDGDYFTIETPAEELQCRILVVATGTKPKKANLQISREIPPGLILSEIVSILNIKGRKIAIIGAGDAAFDYALNLSRRNDVIILNRGNNIKCLPILWARAQDSVSIKYRFSTKIDRVNYDKGRLVLECSEAKGNFSLEADYLITAVGREANLDFLSSGLNAEKDRLANEGLLYFIGDVTNGIYRQTAICAGQGVLAAMKISNKLGALKRN